MVTGLIALMVVALLGIIALQVVWMKNALDVRNELFDRSVNDALVKTSERMEMISDVFMVNNMVGPNPFHFSQRQLPQPILHRVYGNNRPALHAPSSGSSRPSKHQQIELVSKNGELSANIQFKVVQLDSVIETWEHVIDEKIAPFFNDSVAFAFSDSTFPFVKQMGNKVERLKSVAGKMALELELGPGS